MNSVLKLSNFFYAVSFLFQSVQSSLKMPVLKTRLYTAEIICSGEYVVDPYDLYYIESYI